MVLKGYFDDSGDDKKKRFSAVGGLVGAPIQWSYLEKDWSVATYDLRAPFHATDCESQRGCCEGWHVHKTAALMKKLTGIIESHRLCGFGAIVPVAEYRAVFPKSGTDDPYFLALKQTIINMAYVCRLATLSGHRDTVTICHETGPTSAAALQIYEDLKALPGWNDSKYLVGFSVGDKRVCSLQAADLIAREAFKYPDNLGIRKPRKPLKALHKRISFHLWTRATLEHLKAKGGQENLEALTTWGQNGEQVPQMINWFSGGFNFR
ncbi:MAG TPA: hypothetical protein VLM42_21375 [Bryobacteraceae bacterium]|nr:hypothetical protein [Bryobacteraceae bacterium]